jgi:hypothetical protein
MAIKYSDLNKKVNTKPLTEEELSTVSSVEAYIDSEIIRQFKESDEIKIDLCIANFRYDSNTEQLTNIKDSRREKMFANLIQLYKKAGWKVEVFIDDQLDGPNMSGGDYFILRGK